MPKGGRPDKGGGGGSGGGDDGGDSGVIDLGAIASKKKFKTYQYHPEDGILVPIHDFKNQSGPATDMTVLGSSSSEMLYLDEANDTANMGDGNDWVVGNLGNDSIAGEGHRDILFGDFDGGWSTYDILGDDTLDGGDGDDDLWGDTYREIAAGHPPEDSDPVTGGDDSLIGGAGNDNLVGDSWKLDGVQGGADTLEGGSGNDFLWGDAYDLVNGATGGADVFVFADGSGDDIVFDFRAEDDGDMLALTWGGSVSVDKTATIVADGEVYSGTLLTNDRGSDGMDTIFLVDADNFALA